MTTFHDPPPQSRRATRQSERERASDEQPTVEGFTTFPSPEAEKNHVDEASANADAEPKSAPTTPQLAAPNVAPPAAATAPPATAPSAPADSRLSAEAAYRAAPPPLPQTQNSGLAPPARPTDASATPSAPTVAPTAAAETATTAATPSASGERAPERTLTRRELRELRARQEAELEGDASDTPGASQATPAATQATPAATTFASAQTSTPAPAAPTQASNPAPASSQSTPAPTPAPAPAPTPAPAPAPAAAPNANADAVPHYPYSGSAAQKPAAQTPAASLPQPLTVEQEVPAYIEPPALVDPLAVVPEAAAASAPTEDALSAFESLLANADGSAKEAVVNDSPRSPLIDRLRDSGPAKSVSDLNFADTTAPSAADPATAASSSAAKPNTAAESHSDARSTLAGLLGFAPERPAENPAAVGTPVVDKPLVGQPAAAAAAPATNLSNARAEFDEQARKRLEGVLPVAGSTPVAPQGAPSLAPTVDPATFKLAAPLHWSRQVALSDESNAAVVSRTIGSGSSATSALVLPAIPFAKDIRGPLNSSGQAMLTGSIDLPNSLSASGVSDRFDHADIDSLLDLNDSDMVSTDSAPVRAVKAVSTFSNQSVTQTQKPKGTRALTVLLISACSMAVVVAGLLVAAFAFNML
ncbi:hypothetical protein [Salinibacterium sp. PAMC 21357]|uniref:hypothetical protein n=1 Tax=Salinibacterium sp. PAMC 21357 TaxID=1112215 RepID=UPI0002887FB2|nr:hypothetical protein [Salinibacterium sp. PAMC 21357]